MKANKLVGIIISVIAIIILSIVGYIYKTKSYSPFEVVNYENIVKIEYCRPSKKGREVFGALVPYNKIWRTGANEASTLSCTQALNFGGKRIEAGTYSLWTIPGEKTWEVILNSETGQWGVDMEGNANMDPEKEIIRITTDVIDPDMVFEMFTITLDQVKDGINMVLVWDQTMIVIPLSVIQ